MLSNAGTEEQTHATASVLCKLIHTDDFHLKIELAKTLRLYFPSPITAMDKDELKELRHPGRSKKIKIITEDELSHEKFSEYRSQVEYLHAIANIELLAVEITAMGLIKFGSENQDFIRRQLLTLAEKAAHFQMLDARLQDFGMSFGMLPVNLDLWEHAWTCKSELEQQVFVACYLEARRLDLSPKFLKKMIKAKDEKTTRLMKVILAEELKHIKMGMKYLTQKAVELEKDPDKLFKSIITRVMGKDIKSDIPINEEYRRLAGFSKDQINLLKTGA